MNLRFTLRPPEAALRPLWIVPLLWLAFVPPAVAVEPDEMLDDPALEARARAISAGLRCVVCRNQSIDDSNAPLARDLRILLRERLEAGDTDEEAVAYLVDRYGEYILLKPPFSAATLALWIGPAVMLIGATFGFAMLWRRRTAGADGRAFGPETDTDTEPQAATAELTEADRALLDRILRQEEAK